MFFPASKLFWQIAEPITFLTLIALVGVVLSFTRWTRGGRRLAAFAVLAIAAIVFTPFSSALLRPLEDRFPPPPADLPAPTGIIVLGGGLEVAKTIARGQTILDDDGMRLVSAVQLARRYPSARLVFTGGSADPEHSPPEAPFVHKFWLDFGVPENRMSFDDKARNTWENALYTRDIVKPQPGDSWLLVTSAWHMPRSMGIFRRLGFNVRAYPVAYRTFGNDRDWAFIVAAVDRISMLDLAVHEWFGLLAYRLTHKTNALFPAP